MAKVNYRDEEDRSMMQARLNALQIAHDRDMPAEEVVLRAKAYIEFVESLGGN